VPLERGWWERGGTYHVRRRDGRIVADRSSEGARRQYSMAQQARTVASLHKRAVYRARN
jgi:hypothetical protein